MPEPYMTPKELAKYLGVSERTVRRWVAEENLPHYRIRGKLLRFRASDVDGWMERFRSVEAENERDSDA